MSIRVTIENEEEVVIAILKEQLTHLDAEIARTMAESPHHYELNKKDWRRLRKALIRVINYNALPSEQIPEE